MEKVLPEDKPIESFEIEDDFPGLGRRVFNLNARKISQAGNVHAHRMLLVFEDITDRKQRERDAFDPAAERDLASHQEQPAGHRRPDRL